LKNSFSEFALTTLTSLTMAFFQISQEFCEDVAMSDKEAQPAEAQSTQHDGIVCLLQV
jgi:hypothetical protein